MASSSRKKTTMAKLNREAAVRERRQRKKIRKDARKQAALDGTSLEGDTLGPDADAPGLEGQATPLDGATPGPEHDTAAPGPDGEIAGADGPRGDVPAVSTSSPLAAQDES